VNRKRWLWVGGIVVGLVGVWFALRGEPLAVETAMARMDTLSVALTEEGRTRVADSYVVAAPVTGRVSRIDLDAGDSVRAGQAVAGLAPPPTDTRSASTARADLAVAESRVEEARAEVETSRRGLDQAEREYERRIPLFEMGAISGEVLERARTEAETARARLARAEATLAAAGSSVVAARARLIGVDPGQDPFADSVRSPVTGVVLHVYEQSERVVAAGTPLLEVSGTGGVEFVVDLLTAEAVRVDPGDAVRITGWGEDRTLAGRVRYVEPAAFTEVSALGVEEQRVNVVGDILQPPSGLGAGFRLDVSILVWSGEDVLVVPGSALFRRPSGWGLFVVQDGRAQERVVEIGRRGSDRVQILSGVEPGEEVVLYPSGDVDDGVPVRSVSRR